MECPHCVAATDLVSIHGDSHGSWMEKRFSIYGGVSWLSMVIVAPIYRVRFSYLLTKCFSWMFKADGLWWRKLCKRDLAVMETFVCHFVNVYMKYVNATIVFENEI